MTHKNTVFISLLLISATAAISQTESVSLNSQPSRAIGQPQLFPEAGAPNRVEGREFWSPQNIAIDTTSTPPSIYVSDLSNNRILAWKNATQFNNGQPADLVIGQQDFFSTNVDGPGGTAVTGLYAPTGLAVDSKGNLYAADSGNNRVLRYPKPFAQQGQVNPDMWLGQPSLASHNPNYTGQVSAQGLAMALSNSLFQAGLAFDGSGNLWVADPGNSRVVRYPAASLTCSNCGSTSAPADIVIGQSNLSSQQPTQLPATTTGFQQGNQFGLVDGVAFDSNGYLYVTDTVGGVQGRVLVFTHPSSQPGNASADRIMGIVPNSEAQALQQSGSTSTQVSEFIGQTLLYAPSSVFFLPDNSVGVVDTSYNRITIFPPYSQWPGITTHFSPQATALIGQTDYILASNQFANQEAPGLRYGTPVPTAATLAQPTSAVFLPATKELFICDSGNNRVIVMPQTSTSAGTGFANATRVLGQDQMNKFSANLVEGKEFDFSIASQYADASIALDTTGSTPHLWVSDPRNHRVLGFKDARTLTPNSTPDIVLGQPDKSTAVCNYSNVPGQTGSLDFPTQSSLCFPFGITVDAQGGVFVADAGNSRVLHFANPWNFGTTALQPADLVLGQSSFTHSVAQASQTTMDEPYGVAISGKSGLVVSDLKDNRVLFFPFSNNGAFTPGTDNGKPAKLVFGQGSFTTVTQPAGSGLNQLNGPRNVACDTNGQVYVTDTGNNRVLIFGDPNNPQTSGSATLALSGLNSPRGIYVNSGTGEIWVANTGSGTLVRYPSFDSLIFNATATATIQDVVSNTLIPTIAVAQDQYGDLFVADALNRVAVYYQGFTAVNAASSLSQLMAPGMLGTLYPKASTSQFGSNTATQTGNTWPTSLGDIQVTVNGTAAPLQYVSPGQINVQFPISTPVNANAEVEIVQVSTGQILGAQQIPINTVAPAIFTTCQANQTGSSREACVRNQDNTVNSASNPALRGSVISIFATGQGAVSNAPADGTPSPTSPLAQTPGTPPRVAMGGCFIDNCGPSLPGDVGTSGSATQDWVSFSGLAPGFIGLWQVNAQIPMGVAPGVTTLLVQINNVPSSGTCCGFTTYFYVK